MKFLSFAATLNGASFRHPGQGKREASRTHILHTLRWNSLCLSPKFTFRIWNPTFLKTISALWSITQGSVQRSDTFLPKCHLLQYSVTWHTDNRMLHLLLELIFHLYHLNNTECHVCFTNCQFRLPKYTVFFSSPPCKVVRYNWSLPLYLPVLYKILFVDKPIKQHLYIPIQSKELQLKLTPSGHCINL